MKIQGKDQIRPNIDYSWKNNIKLGRCYFTFEYFDIFFYVNSEMINEVDIHKSHDPLKAS